MSEIITSKLSPQRLLITLNGMDEGDMCVRSCEIIGANFRNRTSFGETQNLWDVFIAPLANSLADAISRVTKSSELIVLPEFVFEAPGLVLGGLNIMAADVAGQGRQIILRFKHFIGSLNAALHSNIAISPSLPDYRERLLTETLSDIAIPLYNLCQSPQFSEPAPETFLPVGAAKVQLDEKSHELGFYMELLKRYVEESSRDAPQVSPPQRMSLVTSRKTNPNNPKYGT